MVDRDYKAYKNSKCPDTSGLHACVLVKFMQTLVMPLSGPRFTAVACGYGTQASIRSRCMTSGLQLAQHNVPLPVLK